MSKPTWYRVSAAALYDRRLQQLRPSEFKRKFFAALDGEHNEFSEHMRPGSDRPAAAVWAWLRRHVFERDDFTCQYCGARGGKLECDHVIPVSRGGSSEPDNLATACFACNRAKAGKTPEEWQPA